jgi:aromatic ring-opening dioxygenase catalytic subunit (LigB family)
MHLPVFAIPHGAGPCFSVDLAPPFSLATWEPLRLFLERLATGLPVRPSAIVAVSAHWEEAIVTINAASDPGLLFDYQGFPEEAYRLKYPVKGAPEIANRLGDLLNTANIPSQQTKRRGLDHGVFVPLMVMFPFAEIPIVQLSLRADLDASFHLKLGAAIAPLRRSHVLIVGSGSSYHNLRKAASGSASDPEANAFDAWLTDALTRHNGSQRLRLLEQWERAPGATDSHPRAEHFIPYMVAAGAALDDFGIQVYNTPIMGKPLSGFRFE